MKKLVILGSTGSIGKQVLDVVRMFPKKFKIFALSCNSNIDLFKKQIKEFKPKYTSIFKETGIKGLNNLAMLQEADLVVNALAGEVGIEPTVCALKAGKQLAIANKEAIVCDGERIMSLAKRKGIKIIPIDSEQTGIFQCLEGRNINDVEKIILTCSGGPFLGMTKKQLKNVTAKDALKHPTWKMGAKVSIDSATLANKGMEVIETMYLFNLNPSQIEVVIHPQSKIHAFVYFKDGTCLAQMTNTDMRIPISYALNYPEKVQNKLPRLELADLTFQKPDMVTFPSLKIAYEVAKRGGDYPRKFCKANEEAVKLFLEGKIRFLEIFDRLKNVLL